MGGAEAPAGGLPWIYAIPVIVFLVGAAVGVAKWSVKKVEDARADRDAKVQLASDSRDSVRAELTARLEECERRADERDRRIQEHLQEALDEAYSQIRGTPRPRTPPAGVVRRKRKAEDLASELTGMFRKGDIDMSQTQ